MRDERSIGMFMGGFQVQVKCLYEFMSLNLTASGLRFRLLLRFSRDIRLTSPLQHVLISDVREPGSVWES